MFDTSSKSSESPMAACNDDVQPLESNSVLQRKNIIDSSMKCKQKTDEYVSRFYKFKTYYL